eukprot:365312-Chlamydomonas_euryale.AAC.13
MPAHSSANALTCQPTRVPTHSHASPLACQRTHMPAPDTSFLPAISQRRSAAPALHTSCSPHPSHILLPSPSTHPPASVLDPAAAASCVAAAAGSTLCLATRVRRSRRELRVTRSPRWTGSAPG